MRGEKKESRRRCSDKQAEGERVKDTNRIGGGEREGERGGSDELEFAAEIYH